MSGVGEEVVVEGSEPRSGAASGERRAARCAGARGGSSWSSFACFGGSLDLLARRRVSRPVGSRPGGRSSSHPRPRPSSPMAAAIAALARTGVLNSIHSSHSD